MDFSVMRYTEEQENKWDSFVLQDSMNGTFLQTRKFINYHPKDRFTDFSLIIFKGNTLVACVLGCEYIEENQKVFFSHKGTTFGGIIIGKQIYNATSVNKLIDSIEIFLQKNSFDKIYLKMTPSVCQTAHCGRCKPRFVLGEFTSPIVPYRNLPQTPGGMTADCRSLV